LRDLRASVQPFAMSPNKFIIACRLRLELVAVTTRQGSARMRQRSFQPVAGGTRPSAGLP